MADKVEAALHGRERHWRGGFEIVRTDAGWHVRVLGANGEPLATSEVLTSAVNAESNVDAICDVVTGGSVIVMAKVRHVDERSGM